MTNKEILKQFNKWADDRIADLESLPLFVGIPPPFLKGRLDALRSAKLNLARIIDEEESD